MAQNCGRCRARHAQGCLRASGRLWPRAQTIAAVLSGDSLGQNQTGPIQFASGHIAATTQASRSWLGNLSNYSRGVRARLSLRMRVLHRNGFFGDSIRFRTNESVVNELLLLKARAREEGGQIAVFFIDDNFAINVKRTKSLLRDIIAADAQVHWVAQISANLLRDEELVDLIAA